MRLGLIGPSERSEATEGNDKVWESRAARGRFASLRSVGRHRMIAVGFRR